MSDGLTLQAEAEKDVRELVEVEEAFSQAMISNDVARIRACIADDWVLVTPEAGVVSSDRLLRAIEAGRLSHDTMTKDIVRVRVYGETAVVTTRGQNTGMFCGAPISADEWVTDVYVKADRQWRCTLTHLTPVAAEPSPAAAKGAGDAPGQPAEREWR